MRVRRLVLVTLAYVAGAWVVDLLLRELVPVLVLPPLFLPLARGLLALGLVATLAAAWTYEGGKG
ncbi:MAG: hypothetical protein PVI57_09180 [Gemmatimonadota bacterium]|jgi:hypothetical protein